MNTPTQHTPAEKQMPTKSLISREEIATILGVTYDQVRRNESRWGIDRARRDLTPRCVRFRTALVWANFQAKGWV